MTLSKGNLPTTTFIALASQNSNLGDWLIDKFLKPERNRKQARLVGELCLCNVNEAPFRLARLKNFILRQISLIGESPRIEYSARISALSPYISTFIQSIELIAPELKSKVEEGG